MTHRNDNLWSDGVAVTPSDTAEQNFSGLYVGGAGDVALKGLSGTAFTLKAVPVGTILPFAVNRVMSTNTTATLIIGLVP